jgi:hypothetical protein
LLERLVVDHHGGTLEHAKPWLAANARRLRLMGAYEDFTDLEIKSETLRVAQEILGGE